MSVYNHSHAKKSFAGKAMGLFVLYLSGAGLCTESERQVATATSPTCKTCFAFLAIFRVIKPIILILFINVTLTHILYILRVLYFAIALVVLYTNISSLTLNGSLQTDQYFFRLAFTEQADRTGLEEKTFFFTTINYFLE